MSGGQAARRDGERLDPRRGLVATAVGAGLGAAAASWTWAQLPADAAVPIHWNAAGEVDGYGGRSSLFLGPLLLLAVGGLLAVLPRVEPRRDHLARSQSAYTAVWVGVVVLLTALQLMVCGGALGREWPVARIVGALAGGLLVVVGNYLPKLRSSVTFGIRTPWTLASERSWRRTHRAGGPAFVGLGLVTVVLAAVAPVHLALAALVGGTLALTVGLAVLSWVVWRDDPLRTR